MKVTLIAPNAEIDGEGVRKGKPLFPPLSIMTVAAVTPPDIEVEIIDEAVQPLEYDTLPDLVGITVSTATAKRAYQIADRLRGMGKTVVMGGVHVSALPEEALGHADSVVIGEAEGKWERLLHDFRNGSLQNAYASEELASAEDIPAAARNLISSDNYLLANTVQTSRGCPFNCSFCSVSAFFGRTFRVRPLERVLKEIRSLPGDMVLFVDDNIMGFPKYARELFEAVRPMKKRWFGQASMAMLKHPELIPLAAESGCKGLFVGMETLSDTNLDKIGKQINRREDYERVTDMLHDHGIGILGAFIFGFDEDDESVFQEAVEFVNNAGLDLAQFSILTPFPGTQLYTDLCLQGRITDTDWSRYDGAHVVFEPTHLSVPTLLDGLRRAYQQVYSYGAILRRLGPSFRSRSLSWMLNVTYRQRVMNWLDRLAQTSEALPGTQAIGWEVRQEI